MKKIIVILIGLLTQQIVQAQGMMTYVSSLSTNSTGAVSVGSDSWMAADFKTGNNVGGYELNLIQLGMTDATGNPSAFMVMVYSAGGVTGGIAPGSSLGTLNGSDNPSTADIYTYIPTSSLTLLPSTDYFIVLTAGTTVANGAYGWSESAYPPNINTWGAGNGILHSSNGSSGWTPTPYSGIAQFAITATPIPEPSILSLIGLSSLLFILRRK